MMNGERTPPAQPDHASQKSGRILSGSRVRVPIGPERRLAPCKDDDGFDIERVTESPKEKRS
jgi:hypothetical protein